MQQVYTRSSTSIELVNSKHVSSLPRDWLSGRGRPSRDNHDGRERRDCVDDSTKSVQYLIIHEQWKGKVATAVAVRIRWADARRRNKKESTAASRTPSKCNVKLALPVHRISPVNVSFLYCLPFLWWRTLTYVLRQKICGRERETHTLEEFIKKVDTIIITGRGNLSTWKEIALLYVVAIDWLPVQPRCSFLLMWLRYIHIFSTIRTINIQKKSWRNKLNSVYIYK